MSWAQVAVAIIIAVTISRYFHTIYAGEGRDGDERRPDRGDGTTDDTETRRLREELKSMKERLAVLERLATDGNDSGARLDREIEKLRDRNPN